MSDSIDCVLAVFTEPQHKSALIDFIKTVQVVSNPHDIYANDVLNFDTIIPVPEEYVAIDRLGKADDVTESDECVRMRQLAIAKYGCKYVGEWTLNNWGCSWNAQAPTHWTHHKESAIRTHFSTRYGAPTLWLIAVSKKFPELHFVLYYMNEYESFVGVFTAHNGIWSGQDHHPDSDEGVALINERNNFHRNCP